VIDAREREAKLVAHAGFRLPDFEGVAEGVTVEALAPEQLDATYYDTADLRLARSGVTTRYRTASGVGVWTVKLPEGKEGPALVRRELNFDGPAGSVPSPVTDMVRALMRSRQLVPVARLRTKRSGVTLRDAEGLRVADIVDDEVSVYEGRRVATRFREVEVELLTDGRAGDLLDTIVERLITAGCRDEPAVPKVVRALGHRALEPPDVVVGELDGSATAADLVRTALAASVDRLLRHDPGVRVGDDPDWATPVVEELRWLGGALGEVRDADVLGERLRRQSSLLPERDAAGLGGLFRRLARQRDEARGRLLATVASPRYVTLLEVLVTATQVPPVMPEAHDTKAVEVAPDLVARRWRHLDRSVDALGDDPPDEELHQVRILAKRCRYAAEAVAPVIGKPARRFASAVADLQTVLGDHQDAVVAEGWLRDAASAAPKTALVCGELIAVQLDEARRLRDAWPKAWKAASAKKLRSWM
jgi:CHAD domain-containing protein